MSPALENGMPPPAISLMLRLEGLAVLGATIVAYGALGGNWWLFVLLILAPDLALMNALIDACAAAGEPAIARVTAETVCGRKLGAEILITPLKVDATLGNRYLGLFQTLGGQDFLGGRNIQRLRLGSLHPPEAKAPAGMRLVVVND